MFARVCVCVCAALSDSDTAVKKINNRGAQPHNAGRMSAWGARLASPLVARRVLFLTPRRAFRSVRTPSMASPSSRMASMSLDASEDGAGTSSDRDAVTRTGTCLCGAVIVMLTGKPTAVSICHCVICRKLSGAPFSAQALVKGTQVSVVSNGDAGDRDGGDGSSQQASVASPPALLTYASSPAVERHRCAACQSPVYATLAKGKMAAVPLTVLDGVKNDDELAPTHHMYYGDRIMDFSDDLPKYVKSAGRTAELWKGD